MASKIGTDRDTLTHKAYASDEALAVRQRTHDLYSEPRVQFPEWVLDRITWRGDEYVLDVGAGPGLYFEPLRKHVPNGMLIAADLSLGMAKRAAEHGFAHKIPTLNSDVQKLPFPSATFDVVLANHMLYHVPDLDSAISEMRRVLKPEGLLVAATNSRFSMLDFAELLARGCLMLGVDRARVQKIFETMESGRGDFYLEDAAIWLARHFYAVERSDLPGVLVFPEPGPVIEYLNSMRALREPYLPPTVRWEALMEVIGQWLATYMTSSALAIEKLSGVLIATDDGGFAKDYVARLRRYAEAGQQT